MASELTHDDVARILKLVDEASRLEELEVAYGDFHLHVRRKGAGPAEPAPSAPRAAPAPSPRAAPEAPAAAPPKEAPEERPVPEGMEAVRAPMMGSFYRSPAPGEKPFIEVGQSVAAEDTVCLIEVMKLFNSISAGVDGTVVAIPAQNGALVEYNHPLVYVMPDPASEE